MRVDMTKKRMKLVKEGTITWTYEEKKKTFVNLIKPLGYKDPCPHFYVPHITVGYSYEQRRIKVKCETTNEEIPKHEAPSVVP